jgi:hypothetical protein
MDRVPDYIVKKTLARTAENKAKNEEWRKKLSDEKAEKKRKLQHAMANPRRSARLAAKRRGGLRRTRRK